MGLKNVRDLAKRERQYYASNDLQFCRVCSRAFVKRKGDDICSISCRTKAEESAAPDASQ
jgi:hypothetical protein